MFRKILGIKEKAKAKDIGPALVIFVHGISESDPLVKMPTIYEGIKTDGININKVRTELFFLHLFSIDFASYQLLGRTHERKVMLDAFYQQLLSVISDISFLGEENLKSELGLEIRKGVIEKDGLVLGIVNNRLSSYSQIPFSNDQFFAEKIGAQFCNFITSDRNIYLKELGTIEFTATMLGVFEFMKPYKIVL